MSTTQRLLICLLGGRIQPAAMTAILTQPDVVACIVSADQPTTAGRLLALLQDRGMACAPYPTQEVAAASALATEQAVQTILTAYPAADPIISLTGAAMPMGVGACAAARRAGCPAYYLNTARRALVDLAHEDSAQPVDLHIPLADFLQVHGLRIGTGRAAQINSSTPPLYAETLKLYLEDLTVTRKLQQWLGQEAYSERPWRKVWTLDDCHLPLLERLAELGLLSDLRLQRANGGCVVHAAVPDLTHREFLTGHWLEYYAYTVARNLQHEDAPLFDSAAHSLRMQSSGSEREIDFIGLRGSIPLIASCKTSAREPWNKSALDEVVTVGKNLGDNYCTKLYITSQSAPHPAEPAYAALLQFREQAHNAKVVIVTGDELAHLDKILLREAVTPTYTWL